MSKHASKHAGKHTSEHWFRKIKYNGTEVQLTWTTDEKVGVEILHSVKSEELPHPELAERLRAFTPHVLKLLELPESYGATLQITGLSINVEDDGRCGLVVTCVKRLAETNAPLILNTPHLRELSDEVGPGFLSREMLDCLAGVERAAQGYLDGRRAQIGMFDAESGS